MHPEDRRCGRADRQVLQNSRRPIDLFVREVGAATASPPIRERPAHPSPPFFFFFGDMENIARSVCCIGSDRNRHALIESAKKKKKYPIG